MIHGDRLVGTYVEHGVTNRVSVRVELRTVHGGETVDHFQVESLTEFVVSASVDERRRNGRWVNYRGGQCVEEVLKVTSFAEGWDQNKARRLVELWERYHLNAMKAGCAHMVPAPVGAYSDLLGFTVGRLDNPSRAVLSHYTVNRALECPHTGYRYGHAWLKEVLPEHIKKEIEEVYL